MGVITVNDRYVSLLENYEIEVLRTWKGRGAVLCETDKGTLILKEYAGHKDKCVFQNAVLQRLWDKGFFHIETIIKNKEDQLLTEDTDGTCYILKTYFEGRECDVKDKAECALAMETLAKLHRAGGSIDSLAPCGRSCTVDEEFDKHNRELNRVRKFLKEKSQKTDFEIYLMRYYEYFFQMAVQTAGKYKEYNQNHGKDQSTVICHGDYQHHNLLITGRTMNVINFEKCGPDNPVRDIYLFMRKLLEKSDWSESVGFDLLNAYEKENGLEKEDYTQLYYRLAYPEKFWKIVNFYYNSGKAWIPGKNLEKLIRVYGQENEKKEFLNKFKQKYGILT
ncbi:MAG: CotS family spore coat protein, partial [Suilimivivens sp.]